MIQDQRTIYFPSTFSTPEQVLAHWQLIAQVKGFVRDGERTMKLAEQGEPVAARVEHGRWLADCPCGGGMAAWVENPLVACLDCGRVFPVEFPDQDERLQAERVLSERPEPNRNWTPGDETVEALHAENASARKLGLI